MLQGFLKWNVLLHKKNSSKQAKFELVIQIKTGTIILKPKLVDQPELNAFVEKVKQSKQIQGVSEPRGRFYQLIVGWSFIALNCFIHQIDPFGMEN